MTSSILTPSQSGIIGEGGRKVLKTRVQILGRFLMEPDEELGMEAARRLAERATSAKLRLRTQMTLFSAGLRLGERGVFASMPLEFVKYHRLSDLVAPGAGFQAVLVICVRDYDQRCATVVQFKDDVCLRVVVDVINRHRRAQDEDVARLSDLQSSVGSLVVGGGRGGQASRGPGGGNWQLMAPDGGVVNGPGKTTTDGIEQQPQQRNHQQQHQQQNQQQWREETAASGSTSMLMDEDDYAVIRRSRVLWTGDSHAEESQQQQRSSATRSEVSVETPPVLQQIWNQEWQQQQQHQQEQPQSRQQQQPPQRHHYQKHNKHQQPSHSNWTFGRDGSGRSSTKLATVPDAEATNFEEVETAAVFETPDGPPTLLNELVRRGGGGHHRRDGGGGTRFKEVPPEFVARVQVSRRSSAAEANGGHDSDENDNNGSRGVDSE